MSKLRPVYEPKQGPMKIVGLLSGSGTRLVDVLEHQDVVILVHYGCRNITGGYFAEDTF